MNTKKHPFQDFTNLYELSKTLRFELKPVGNTQKMLEENKVFEKDAIVAENYREAKKWFDMLHKEFINDTLLSMHLNASLLESFESTYSNFKNSKDQKTKSNNKKNLDAIATKLRKEVLFCFEKNAEKWRDVYIATISDASLKKKVAKLKGLDLFFKVEVFGLLKQKYPQAIINEKSIFDSFNKFSTYFTGFHQTRQNFYKDDGKATAVATRIIDENLPKFIDNKKTFEDKYEGKYNDLFATEEKSIFSLNKFTKCLAQKQIDDYNYLVSELRSKINKKRQGSENKNEFPFFKTLFKQILGESGNSTTEQDDFIEITADDEVFIILKKFIDENTKYLPKSKLLFSRLIDEQLQGNGEYAADKIYVAGRFINQISNKYFADWNTIRNLFSDDKKSKKIPDFVSLATLKEKLLSVDLANADLFRDTYKKVLENEKDKYHIFLKIWKQEFDDNFKNYTKTAENIQKMLAIEEAYNNKEDSGQKDTIRLYVESTLSLYQMMKYFSLEKGKERNWNPDGLDEDAEFYNAFDEYYGSVHAWQYFNVFRNYLTKKPYSEDKIKLNFENGTLLDGWDKNKERDNYGIILQKDGKHYLGLMHKNHNTIFDGNRFGEEMKKVVGNNVYHKMAYKFLPDPKKMLPKVCFSQKGLDFFKPSAEIVSIKNNEEFKKNTNNFSISSLHKIIDYYKNCLNKYEDWKVFNFVHVKPTNEYQDNIGEFYKDVEKNAYKIWFEEVSAQYIDKRVENGELYLFEIYNKDFSQKSNGNNKNLHTLYWEEVFSEENRKNPVIKLNGQAEVFFRKATENIEKKEIKTTKGIAIDDKQNNPYHFKRYSQNKIFFHCPLKLNYTKDEVRKDKSIYKGTADAFSIKVREYLAGNSGVNIIGIDRGEKHLAYYSVVDQKGNILDIGSFNKIGNTDYHKKLDELEKGRADARKTWKQIGQIKEMKKGYISQVVKKICDLMVKHNAIVVFEDLNVGFKRGRFAIEKQVYQNLELALAKKLNHLVFKEKTRGECGHHTKAFQLTPKIDNFQDVYKQCGFMFYIPASYTSAICPMCGFRKNIPTPVETREKNINYLKNFDIAYEKDKDRFRLAYKRSSVTGEKLNRRLVKSDGFRIFEDVALPDEFIFYSKVTRLQYRRSKDNRGGQVEKKLPHDELVHLFRSNDINLDGNINYQLVTGNYDDAKVYKPLIFIIRLIMQLRNAATTRDENGNVIENESRDFISCPACGFHSEENLMGLDRKYKGRSAFEFNGDANGAYNIARKGGLVLTKITEFIKKQKDPSLMQNQDLTITQEEWDKFVQTNP